MNRTLDWLVLGRGPERPALSRTRQELAVDLAGQVLVGSASSIDGAEALLPQIDRRQLGLALFDYCRSRCVVELGQLVSLVRSELQAAADADAFAGALEHIREDSAAAAVLGRALEALRAQAISPAGDFALFGRRGLPDARKVVLRQLITRHF